MTVLGNNVNVYCAGDGTGFIYGSDNSIEFQQGCTGTVSLFYSLRSVGWLPSRRLEWAARSGSKADCNTRYPVQTQLRRWRPTLGLH